MSPRYFTWTYFTIQLGKTTIFLIVLDSHTSHFINPSALNISHLSWSQTLAVARGVLLNALHPANTLCEHLYSKCTAAVHFPLLFPSSSYILHAPASGFCCKGTLLLPTTKGPWARSTELQSCTVTSNQHPYNAPTPHRPRVWGEQQISPFVNTNGRTNFGIQLQWRLWEKGIKEIRFCRVYVWKQS